MILDVGCKWNKYLGAIGLDLKRYANDIVGDALRLPFRDCSAEKVVARQFLEHVDAQAFIRECWRVLEPQGELLIETPNALYLLKTLSVMAKRSFSPHPEHIQTFGDAELRQLLTRNGFGNVRLEYFGEPSQGNPALRPLKRLMTWVVKRFFPGLDRTLRASARKIPNATFAQY